MTTELIASKVSAELTAIVTRADGTIENLGVISYWHKNPFKRAFWYVTKFLRGL